MSGAEGFSPLKVGGGWPYCLARIDITVHGFMDAIRVADLEGGQRRRVAAK